MDKQLRQKVDITPQEVAESPGKFDDALFPIEKIGAIISQTAQELRVEYVGDDGSLKPELKFMDGIHALNKVIRLVDRTGEEAFGKDFTPEIKSQIVNLILSALGIIYQ
jgi:hypothetical protein